MKHGTQPCLTQWNYELCYIGPPKIVGSWRRALTKSDALEKGMTDQFLFLPWEPHEQYEKAKRYTLKQELPRLLGAQYDTREKEGNSSRKNEEAEPKWKLHPAVDMSVSESKVWCCKEQYCIGTWNVRSMNQGKLEVVKQEMARVNTDIFRNQWTKNGWEWVNLIHMTIISTTMGKKPLEEME